ncbi:PD40 domain-containing protein [Hymenobacter sediminicola]|uniref:PD40 domain-containing protein n=1 Tax=Hymenobacter sediminicola TaxID=2761579 RepID=A0A7G7W5Z2_9BACT|nr:PD40 domain-containing protein [Hymenobacter sediminicola]QNH61785.1 PD40 domain-containing protein [Hymenobacter sediminicola]
MKHVSFFRWSGTQRCLVLGAALFVLLSGGAAQAQTSQESFGRVRIQYKKFDWQLLSTQNFNIYYYGGGDVAARRAAEYVEKELQRITALVGYYPYSKTTVMLYNSVGDLRQSNIGLDQDKYQTGGETDLLRMSKVQIAFQGEQTEFKRDLSYQVTRVLLNDMMYGGSLKEVIQSTYLLQLPDWFVGGASAYAAEGWSVEMDDYMRDMTQEYDGNRTAPFFLRNPQLAGQSLWNYIAERYGYTTIQNILNLTRITRDVEVGISSSLNVPYKVFLRDWLAYYRQLNAQPLTPLAEVDDAKALTGNNRKNIFYSQPVLSPNGQQLAYVSNDRGRYQVLVANRDGSGRHTIHRGGYKTPGQQVENRLPVLAWRGNGQVAVAEMEKGLMSLRVRPADGGAAGLFARLGETLPFGRDKASTIFEPFQQILDLSYSPDGKSLVFSGVANGQGDLYVLRAGSRRPEKLTNDVFDDIQPSFLPGGSAIVFSSNRWLDSAGTARGSFGGVVNNYDLFLYHLDGRAQPVELLVSTISNEGRPRAISDDEIVYLGEESGIRSVYRYSLRTKQRTAVSSFRASLKDFDYNATTNTLGFVAANRARDFVYLYPGYVLPENLVLSKTARQETLEDRSKPAAAKAAPIAPPVTPAPAQTTSETQIQQVERPAQTANTPINTSDYQFDEDLPADRAATNRRNRTTPVVAAPAASAPLAAANQAPAGPFRYDTRFSIDNVVSSLYSDPLLGLGLIGQVNMSDLFEDHRFRGGIFALTDLRTSNIFAEYTNLKHRYDWSIRYDKQAYFFDIRGAGRLRFARHEIAPTIAYPLTHNLSVRGGPRFVTVSRNVFDELSGTLDIDRQYLGANGELVFDNAVTTGVNMLEGTRMKIGLLQLNSLKEGNQDFGKIYIDLRHYQKIHRQIIWANRASYGQFIGKQKQFFRLGGMDNWIGNDYEDSQLLSSTTPFADPTEIFYQQFVTNLRGFNYSKRVGPRYVLFNSELRVPIVQYLSNKPIYSGFFRNLQLTAFGDAGSAYSGNNPFNENNSFNTKVVGGSGNAFSATVINFRNPLLIGYGFGIRSTLLGFYGKADVAWGQEDYVQKGPKFYFTLGYDF